MEHHNDCKLQEIILSFLNFKFNQDTELPKRKRGYQLRVCIQVMTEPDFLIHLIT
jgi:hypothetical protein